MTIPSDEQIGKEVDEWLAKYGQPSKNKTTEFPSNITTEYDKARHYVLYHGCMYGLGWECLKWFYKFQESKNDPWVSANHALYEWDI